MGGNHYTDSKLLIAVRIGDIQAQLLSFNLNTRADRHAPGRLPEYGNHNPLLCTNVQGGRKCQKSIRVEGEALWPADRHH